MDTWAHEVLFDAFEMWCFRKMGRISWKGRITINEVLEKLGPERNLLKSVKERQLRYYGHIKRQNGFLTHALEGKLEGKIPRGRPRTTWISNNVYCSK